MKNLFISLATILLALIIGCQENLLNEPDSLLEKKASDRSRNVIKIYCEVQDPLTGSCTLDGFVKYVHQVLINTEGISGLKKISLHLEMYSELGSMVSMAHPEWIIRGKSEDVVYVSEEGIMLLQKTYRITNRNDVVLLVEYMVTTNGVGISSVNLVEIEK